MASLSLRLKKCARFFGGRKMDGLGRLPGEPRSFWIFVMGWTPIFLRFLFAGIPRRFPWTLLLRLFLSFFLNGDNPLPLIFMSCFPIIPFWCILCIHVCIYIIYIYMGAYLNSIDLKTWKKCIPQIKNGLFRQDAVGCPGLVRCEGRF